MDIQKLEKLSCLKLKEEDKEKMQNSLEGVFNMMSNLDNLDFPELPDSVFIKTEYRQGSNESETMIAKTKSIDGIHQEDGMFLAPKVIKK